MRRDERIKLLAVASLVLVVTVLHYATPSQDKEFHDIYRRLYYIPIILGALWFGLRGGILTSLVVSIFYLPHILLQWQTRPLTNLDQYLEILLYNVIGVLTGFLAERERLGARTLAQIFLDAGAKLGEAKRHRAELSRCKLCKADLRGADLSQANLSEADLTGARLRRANLTRSIRIRTKVNKWAMKGAYIAGPTAYTD